MFVGPVALGNQDPDWPQQNRGGAGAQWNDGGLHMPGGVNVLEVQDNQNSQRKCVWGLILLSTLLVLHGQRDRYVEALDWNSGKLDSGPPMPWELQAFVLPNESYEATFLAPSLRRTATFVQLGGEKTPLAVNGLAHTVFSGDTTRGVTSVVVGAERIFGEEAGCHGRPCFAGVQKASSQASSVRQLPGASTCYRFVTGASIGALKPSSGSGLLCIRAKQIHAALATSPAVAATNSSAEAVVVWEVSQAAKSKNPPMSCMARVAFPSMRLLDTAPLDSSASVLFDRSTSSIITLGHGGLTSPPQLVADQFDATTLKPMRRFLLPLSLAWYLHAPKMSDGYLLFLGSEPPFVGSLFVVDLKKHRVYQQEPPKGESNQKPRRWVLPYEKFVQRMVLNSAREKDAFVGHLGVVGGPCAAAWTEDLGEKASP